MGFKYSSPNFSRGLHAHLAKASDFLTLTRFLCGGKLKKNEQITQTESGLSKGTVWTSHLFPPFPGEVDHRVSVSSLYKHCDRPFQNVIWKGPVYFKDPPKHPPLHAIRHKQDSKQHSPDQVVLRSRRLASGNQHFSINLHGHVNFSDDIHLWFWEHREPYLKEN